MPGAGTRNGGPVCYPCSEQLVRHEELRPQLLFSEMDMLQRKSKVDVQHPGMGAANLSSDLSLPQCPLTSLGSGFLTCYVTGFG